MRCLLARVCSSTGYRVQARVCSRQPFIWQRGRPASTLMEMASLDLQPSQHQSCAPRWSLVPPVLPRRWWPVAAPHEAAPLFQHPPACPLPRPLSPSRTAHAHLHAQRLAAATAAMARPPLPPLRALSLPQPPSPTPPQSLPPQLSLCAPLSLLNLLTWRVTPRPPHGTLHAGCRARRRAARPLQLLRRTPAPTQPRQQSCQQSRQALREEGRWE